MLLLTLFSAVLLAATPVSPVPVIGSGQRELDALLKLNCAAPGPIDWVGLDLDWLIRADMGKKVSRTDTFKVKSQGVDYFFEGTVEELLV